MKFHAVWSVLRVLAILGLGFFLFHTNTVRTVNAGRDTFDLVTHQAELAPDAVQEKLGRIQDSYGTVLKFNFYGIPALVILALMPCARRKNAETVATQRDG